MLHLQVAFKFYVLNFRPVGVGDVAIMAISDAKELHFFTIAARIRTKPIADIDSTGPLASAA